MNQRQTYNALNRLLTILERSLSMYLSYASPWLQTGDEKAVTALSHIVDEQKRLAARVAELVLERGPMDLGEYPHEFYDLHDLSLDFLLNKLVEYQKRDVAALEKSVEELQSDRAAASVAEEALGAARGHLETLEELAAELGNSSSRWLVS
ncbi:MAG: hypothetical protein AB7O59_03620 [Pirellulales bacterium]